MKPSAWVITVVLVVLSVVAAWFFGLDARHAVVLVGAAFAAGVVNGLLESVDLSRPTPASLPSQPRGLADLQALEFSLSSAEPGTRAVLELRSVASSVAAASPGVARSAALERFLSPSRPPALTHREVGDLLDELERISAGSGGRDP